VNLTVIKSKITQLKGTLAAEISAHQESESRLATANSDLAKTGRLLSETRNELTSEKSAREQAAGQAAVQSERANKLNGELTVLQQTCNDAQARLHAYELAGMPPEEIINAASVVKEVRTALAKAQKENKDLLARVSEWEEQFRGDGHIWLPADLKSEVMVADPKWQFAVLNAGEDQGMRKRGELLVSRQGKLVARLIVDRVEKDRCIANVMPGWNLSEVLEGDTAIPAYPRP